MQVQGMWLLPGTTGSASWAASIVAASISARSRCAATPTITITTTSRGTAFTCGASSVAASSGVCEPVSGGHDVSGVLLLVQQQLGRKLPEVQVRGVSSLPSATRATQHPACARCAPATERTAATSAATSADAASIACGVQQRLHLRQRP